MNSKIDDDKDNNYLTSLLQYLHHSTCVNNKISSITTFIIVTISFTSPNDRKPLSISLLYSCIKNALKSLLATYLASKWSSHSKRLERLAICISDRLFTICLSSFTSVSNVPNLCMIIATSRSLILSTPYYIIFS